MFRRLRLAVTLMMVMAMMSGCWDSQDISDSSLVVLGAIDLSRDGGTQFGKAVKYDATVLIPDVNPEAPDKIRVEKVSGASLSGSRDQRAYMNPQIILVRMIRVYLFGETLSIAGLAPVLDSLGRNPLLDNSLYVAMTEGQAGDLTTVQPRDYPDLGIYISELLGKVNQKAFFPVITLHDFRTHSTNPGQNPVLPILRVDNGEVKISGLGLFRKDKLIGRAGLDESRPLTLLRGAKGRAYIPYVITRDGREIDRGTVLAANDRKVRVERRGDRYIFTITITLSGDLIEHESPVLLTRDRAFLPMIEGQIASDMEDECRAFVHRMKDELEVDCIDISKFALAKWRHELEGTVDQGFIQDALIDVKVRVRIRNIGDQF